MQSKLMYSLRKILGKSSFDPKFTRYFFIIDNYLKGYPLSRIEPKNHKDYNPKIEYLTLVAKGLNISIDLNSDLFENRLIHLQRKLYPSDTIWIDRFFYRIKLCEENNIELTTEVVDDSLSRGYVVYNSKYMPLNYDERKQRKLILIFLEKQLGIGHSGRISVPQLLGISNEYFNDLVADSNLDKRHIRITALFNVVIELTMIFNLDKRGSYRKNFYDFFVNNRLPTEGEDESISVINFIIAYPEKMKEHSVEMQLIINQYKKYIME